MSNNLPAMNHPDAETRLSPLNIKPTPIRILVYNTLKETQYPLSLLDIEALLGTVDRSSVSRVLSLFKEKHIVHAFDDGSGSVKYELCSAHTHSMADLHVHFHCSNCGSTYCMNDVKIPEISLPDGFIVENINYVASGLCDKCSSRKSS